MKYAVIETGGKQYKICEGETLAIEKIEKEKGAKIEFAEVLLFVEDGKVLVGNPTLKNIRVAGEIIEQIKGKKIRVAKFRAKSRYRKVKGHRQRLTKVKIERIACHS